MDEGQVLFHPATEGGRFADEAEHSHEDPRYKIAVGDNATVTIDEQEARKATQKYFSEERQLSSHPTRSVIPTPRLHFDTKERGTGEKYADGDGLYKYLPDSYHAKGAERYTEGIPDDLCARCRSVRWSVFAVEDAPSSLAGQRIFELETQEKLRTSTCSLCQLFACIKPSTWNLKTKFLTAIPLVARSLNAVTSCRCAVTLKCGDGTLGIHHSRSDHDDYSPRIISPTNIDYDILKDWLTRCSGDHTECRSERKLNLPGFRVIHCQSNTIIPAPEKCRYVALSYVWGPPSSADIGGQESKFPATIEDSIFVVSALGFQYLWVDRYCIDQEDTPEKQVQIQQMGRIYSESEFTLIAAAGENPSYGLPGVKRRARTPQHHVKLGAIAVVEMFPNTFTALQSCRWASRAWTYQEGFLARRRLIFTDRQVSFVCNRMYSAESIRPNLELGAEDFGVERFQRLFTNNSSMEVVLAYTRRKISYDSDSLNACLGILNSFEKDSHIWGVPIRYDPWIRKRVVDLSWYHEKPTRRQPAFPSWSWTGWQGPIEYLFHCTDIADKECEIHIMGENYSWVFLLEYATSGLARSQAGTPDAPKLLKISAPVLNCRWVVSNWVEEHPSTTPRRQELQTGDALFALFPVTTDVNQVFRVYLDQEIADLNDISDSIAMALSGGFDWSWVRSAILLKPVEGGSHRRIGMLCSEELSMQAPKLVDKSGKDIRENMRAWWPESVHKQTVFIQ